MALFTYDKSLSRLRLGTSCDDYELNDSHLAGLLNEPADDIERNETLKLFKSQPNSVDTVQMLGCVFLFNYTDLGKF